MGKHKKEREEYYNKFITVKYTGGEIEGICKEIDVYLNITLQTPTHIHIIKGQHIEQIIQKNTNE